MATQSSAPTIDVDDLAREKVQEVEEILDNGDNSKVGSIESCFAILKQIITAADLHRTNDNNKVENNKKEGPETSESIYADYVDDHEQFNAVDLTEQFATNSVKWTIRVRAFKSVHRIFNLLISTNSKLTTSNKSTVLKLLPDLIRLSFVAATSPYDDLKIQGFQMFRDLINRFATVEEKEFPGHSILEQYKTQVLSALKPAFNLDAPPYITAIACQVCCQWICRGLEKDSISLKRAYQLMEPSIEKLESQSINPNSLLYQEIELEQERLDILGSWAQFYTTSLESGLISKSLSDLIQDRVESLVGKWWEALKDYALLIMLSPKTMTVSHDNEHVYTKEVALKLFSPVWPRLTLAVTTWLCTSNTDSKHAPENQSKENADGISTALQPATTLKYFRFLCGILLHEFCKCPHLDPVTDSLPESTIIALRSLCLLLSNDSINKNLLEDFAVVREFYTVLVKTLINLTELRSSHKALLKNALSLIFKLALAKFEDNDKVVQYSLARLIYFVRAGLNPSTTMGDEAREHISQQTLFTNLIVVAKSRPNLLTECPEQFSAFMSIVKELFTVPKPVSIIYVIDSIHNLQKNLPRASATMLTERIFQIKQASLLKLVQEFFNCESISKEPQNRALFEAIIKSMKYDLELLESPVRQDSLASLIKTLLSQLDTSQGNSELVGQIMQILRDLEKCFSNEFTKVRDTELKSMIDKVLKPVIKSEPDPRASKKTNAVVKKPSSSIKLKSDFSNFYSKK